MSETPQDTPRTVPGHEREADLLETAWGIIANAGWDGMDKSYGWQDAAVRWRDRYDEWLSDYTAAGRKRIARDAEVLHSEYHPGTFVPDLDSCAEHERADYEARVREMRARQAS